MGKLRFVITNTLLWVSLIFTCFFLEAFPCYLEAPYNEVGGFQNSTFFVLTLILLLLYLFYFVSERRHNKVRGDFLLLALFTSLMVTMSVAIWINPNYIEFVNQTSLNVHSVTFTFMDKLRYNIQAFFALTGLYLLMFFYSRNKLRANSINWLAYAFIFVCIIIIGLSFYLDRAAYYDIFVKGNSEKTITSICGNPNNIGLAMLLTILACIIINGKKFKWWTFIIIGAAEVFNMLSFCATTIFISFVLLPIYMIYLICYAFKKGLASGTVTTIFFIFFSLGLVCLMHYASIDKLGNVSKAYHAVFNYLKDKDFDTFTNRTIIWKIVVSLLNENPLYWLFGRGYNIGNLILGKGLQCYYDATESVYTCHSGFIQTIFNSGLIGFGFATAGFIYFIVACVHHLKKKRIRFVFIYVLCVVTYLAHNAVNAARFFDVTTTNLIAMLLFYLPPVVAYKQEKHPSLMEEVYHSSNFQKRVSDKNFTGAIACACVCLLMTCLFVLCTPFAYEGAYENASLKNVAITVLEYVAISAVFLPYLLTLFYRKSKTWHFILRVALLFLIGGGILFIVAYFGPKNGLSVETLNWLLPVIYAGYLFVVLFDYVILCRGKFRHWIKFTLRGLVVVPNFVPLATALLVGLPIVLYIQMNTAEVSLLTLFSLVALFILGFTMLYFLFPFKSQKEILNEFNRTKYARLKYSLIKEEY